MLLRERHRLALAALLSLVLLPGCKPGVSEHLRLARDAVFEKRPEEALRLYRRALDSLERDSSTEALVLRARALRGAADVYYLELRDMPKAVQVYRELIQQCPEAPETLEGRIHLADILRTHFRDLRGAIRELAQAVARNPPQSAELRYQMAKLYFELGDYQQCELEAGGTVESFPTSVFVDDALFLQAQALAMMEGRKPDAMRAFQEVSDRFPDSDLRGHALFEKGKLLEDAGQSEQAIELWVQALEFHPDPSMIQGVVARTRRRLHATTPKAVGERASAFDHRPSVLSQTPPPIQLMPPAKTSVEAAGGTAAEAEQERLHGGERGDPAVVTPGGAP